MAAGLCYNGLEKVGSTMKNGQMKIVLVLVVLGATLGTLIFIQNFYVNRFVERPVEKALQEVKFVDSVMVKKDDSIYQFTVKIKKAGNVQYEYTKVDSVIKENIKGKEYQLQLTDNRNEKLANELEYLELSIYEAMAKDNYIWLDEIFRETARQDQIGYKLFIDEQRLYIQLVDQEHFLYEVIERSTPASGADKGE